MCVYRSSRDICTCPPFLIIRKFRVSVVVVSVRRVQRLALHCSLLDVLYRDVTPFTHALENTVLDKQVERRVEFLDKRSGLGSGGDPIRREGGSLPQQFQRP